MIFPLAGLLGGAILGALRARAKGGTGKDMVQWGAVFALMLGVVGVFVMIGFQRSAL